MALVSAILTAAGESTRMGRPKPLLSWHGVTLVQYQVAGLLDAGVAEVVVVLGHQHQAVTPYVEGPSVRYVVNPNYRQGKTTSIKAGLRAIDPAAEGILLLAVDQPRPPEIISAVIEAQVNSAALITSLRFNGRGGHPLVFSPLLKSELEAISEERQGVREVLRAHRSEVNEVDIDDPIVRLDLNSPEEYEAAKARYGA
jgi:molybdenum cofactor cytidylyltransferase